MEEILNDKKIVVLFSFLWGFRNVYLISYLIS